jgi:hypothetical protein
MWTFSRTLRRAFFFCFAFSLFILSFITVTAQDTGGISSPRILRFVLVDMVTGQDVRPISNDEAINLRDLVGGFTIRVDTEPATVGSVRFDLNGYLRYRVEDTAPYAIAGDSAWSIPALALEITATPHSERDALGIEGLPMTIRLSFVNLPLSTASSYYIDSVSGLDTNNGLSPQTAWKTVANVPRTTFAAGSRILFRRGQSFSSKQALVLFSSGTPESPITIGAYGAGAAPRLTNTDTWQYANGINIYGSHILVRDIAIVGAKQYGLFVAASDVAVRHIEVTNVGIGIWIAASRASVQNSRVHDLNMIVNDSTPDNDNGAVGIVVAQGDDILLADNELYNLSESSIDYGTDGSGLEIYSIAPIHNLVFTRNLVYNCDNTFEFGSGDASLVDSVSIHHNLFFKCRSAGAVHLAGGDSRFGITLNRLDIDNNTFVDSPAMWVSRPADANTIFLRNNIFALNSGTMSITLDGVVRENNLFYASSQSAFPFSLNASERYADPQFSDNGARNFRLRGSSPAIDAASNLGYSFDVTGRDVQSPPEVGAYAYALAEFENLVLQAEAGDAAVNLVWTRLMTSPQSALLERSVGGGAWETLQSLDGSISDYIDTEISPGQSLCYRVTLYFNDGTTKMSNNDCLTLPVFNRPPVLTTIGNVSSRFGQVTSLNLHASDSEGDSLSFSATGLPEGLALSGETISGTPSFAGIFTVTVTVEDGRGGTDSESFTWTIASGNSAPSVVPLSNQTNTIGDIVTLAITVSDADGDTLFYSQTGLPTGLNIDALSGLVSGSPTAAGSFNVVISVFDNGGLFGTSSFVWTINPSSQINNPPGIQNPGNQTSTLGQLASLQMSANDSDGGLLRYTAVGLPAGLSMDSGTGLVTGIPSVAGNYSVSISVLDSGGLTSSTSFTWTILQGNNPPPLGQPTATSQAPAVQTPIPNPSGNQAPTIQSIPDQRNQRGSTVSLQIIASDPEGSSLSYRAEGLPEGLSINTLGQITGLPSRNGQNNVRIILTDAAGQMSVIEFRWQIFGNDGGNGNGNANGNGGGN